MTWHPQFACPECREGLDLAASCAKCRACDVVFERQDEVFDFMSEARRRRLEPFLAQYRRVRRADGHVAPGVEAYRALPYRPLTPGSSVEWAIRSESLKTLLRSAWLQGAPRRVLDVGAGNGWLSQCLAAAGHYVVAVDANDDAEDGLRVSRRGAHEVPLVRADFDALPFAPGQFDAVVLNASLHYAPDVARTLEAAHTLVAPGGTLVVMDSPWFERDVDGEAMVTEQHAEFTRRYGVDEVVRPGLGYLTFSRLRDVAARLGRRTCFTQSAGPVAWRLRRFVRRRHTSRPPATFGVWMTQ